MNEIKNRIDGELGSIDFELDREAVRSRYAAHLRRRRGAIITAASFAIVIGLVAAIMLSGSPGLSPTATPDDATAADTSHSFFLAASAAEVSEEYLDTLTAEDREVLLSTRGCKIDVEYIENPMMYEVDGETFIRRFKTLHISGNTPVIAYGDDIEYLVFHSDNSAFFSPQLDAQVNDQKIAYDADYPLNSALYWLLPEEVGLWIEDMQVVEGEVDFSQLPRDRITVTAVFTDGSELTHELNVWFNDDGYLVVQDEGGTVYNDYSDVDEHNPFSEESGVMDYRNVERVTVTLYDPVKQEIAVENTAVFVSAINRMKLYEELPQSWMNDKAATIRIELKDGSAHTVRVVYNAVEIDGDKVYRAGYDTADDLLRLCYGLFEQNDGSGIVFGEYPGGE